MAKTKEKQPSQTLNIPHAEGPFMTESFIKKYGIASLTIIALCFGIYYYTTEFRYVLDDKVVITDNKFTNAGFSGIGDILSRESFEGYFGEMKSLVQGNRYRPLSIVTFAIERGIQGDNYPEVSHFINIILYAITCILLMMCLHLVFRNFKSAWYLSIPFAATLIYAAMPIHVEAVANVKGRDEIMSMLFSLWALYAALRYVDTQRLSWLIGCGVTFFLGLMSKENALTFLAIIPLTIYFFGNEKRKQITKVFLTLLGISIGFLILRTSIVGQFIGVPATDVMNNPFLGMTFMEKMGSTFYSLIKYVQLMVFPTMLSHDYYPYQIPKESLLTLIPLLSLVTYAGLAFVAWRGWKQKSVYAYVILFYFCALSIVSNLVVNVGTFLNERFIFMASAGFAIGLAYFLMYELSYRWKLSSWIGLGLVLAITFGYGWKSYDRVPDWEDTMSLNKSAVKASPNSARANAFMATVFFETYKDKFPNAKATDQVVNLYRLLDSTELYANKSVKIIPDYMNGNLMLCGVASERFKIEYDIHLYIKTMKPVILRRPDLPFIKEFSDYLATTGNDEYLWPFYREIGLELLKFSDNRRQWAVQYLTYAYKIKPNDKTIVLGLAQGYEILGIKAESQKFMMLAQNLQ